MLPSLTPRSGCLAAELCPLIGERVLATVYGSAGKGSFEPVRARIAGGKSSTAERVWPGWVDGAVGKSRHRVFLVGEAGYRVINDDRQR